MDSRHCWLSTIAIVLCLTAFNSLAQPIKSAPKLGTVNFPNACDKTVDVGMHTGLALLHHMMYQKSEQEFQRVIEQDPNCALAYWGVAMTYLHPLWPDVPDETTMKKALALLSQAKERAAGDGRALDYITAAEAYYSDGWNRSENQRLGAYQKAWQKVHQTRVKDTEAASFYALALMAYQYSNMAGKPSPEKDYSRLEQAGAIVEKVLQQTPDHPAAHHYIIHAYDMEGLADRALKVAHNYGRIAPDVPHALHMPSHIFTRLGLWDDSISWNLRSADAGMRHSGDAISHHYFHAIDYLSYAYLQKAQYANAKALVDALKNLDGPIATSGATAYTLAAAPARLALETKQWRLAAETPHIRESEFAWKKFPQFEAIIYFTRALGSAKSGDEAAAITALERLTLLRSKVKSPYWNYQVSMQEIAAKAWLMKAQGKTDQALDMMKEAAKMEASSYKHAITPGDVLPLRELYADMLLELNRPELALEQYEISLRRTPLRFNSLFGAANSAELRGNKQLAKNYYQTLLEMLGDNRSDRKEITHAKSYLKNLP